MSAEPGSNVRILRHPANEKLPGNRRLRVNWPANIVTGEDRTACTVLNISQAGACLSLGAVAEAVPLWLIVDRKSIPATIVWRKRDCVGLRFRKAQSWVDGASQQRFDPAAWLRETP